MNILSGEFVIILGVAILVLYLKLRKNRVTNYIPRKSIAIRGHRVLSEISKETPLECLLADAQGYGEDFNLKELPQLPHTEGCNCQLINLNINSSEFFADDGKKDQTRQTDLGPLSRQEFRYYKYTLMISHPDITPADQTNYLNLLQAIPISEAFKTEVSAHLKLSQPPEPKI